MTDTAYIRVTVTLPKPLVDSVRARAGARGLSVYVAEGLRLAEHLADLDDFLAAQSVGRGPLPIELMEEVRRAWPDPRSAASLACPSPGPAPPGNSG